MTGHEPLTAIVFWAFIGIAACGLMVCAAMLYRSCRKDRRWRHDSRVQQRIAELLRQEWVDSLPPEARQRLEASRRHLHQLRERAEAELATEASGGRPHA
jgi:hypothetical protein